MDFTSFFFLLYLTVSACAFRICPLRLRPAFIAIASCGFYLTWDFVMAAALIAVAALAYLTALGLESLNSHRARLLFLLSTVTLTIYLVSFKIFQSFSLGNRFLIPLGISYYSFKLISYLVDVYLRKSRAERDFIALLAYTSFFPQIVAGPIQRASDFLASLKSGESPSPDTVVLAVFRIAEGFFKKLVVADTLAVVVNYGFSHPNSGSSLPNWLALYLYPLQLYADFSGLTDIAIGAGLLFGIRSPENFDAPFLAVNISEFWRRWHMTLTNWMKDYVFVPLNMALRAYGNVGLAASLTTNMVLVGVWHGFSWTFLVFGVLHAVFIVLDAMTSRYRKRYYRNHSYAAVWTKVLGPVFTYHLVAVADVYFRASSISEATTLIGGLFRGLGDAPSVLRNILLPANSYVWTAIPGLILVACAGFLRRRLFEKSLSVLPRSVRWSSYATAAMVTVFLILLLVTRRSAPSPFMYAAF